MNKITLHALAVHVANGMLLLTLCGVAQATPPLPPAALTLPQGMGEKETLLEAAVLPVQIVLREEGVAGILVVASVKPLSANRVDPAPALAREIFRTELKPRQERETTLQVPLKNLSAGEWQLVVRLTGKQTGAGGFSSRLVQYLRVDDKGAVSVLSPPLRQQLEGAQRQQQFDEARRKDERLQPIELLFGNTRKLPAKAKIADVAPRVAADKRIEVRPSALTPYLREHSVDSTATSYTTQDPITVRGRFLFQDIDGTFKPLANAAVHLWDDDTFGDEHLGSVATGWDGRWSFTVNNDDGWLQDGRDLYYTLKLDTTRLSLGSCNFLAGAYEWKSAAHNDMSDGVVLDFGDEAASTDTEAPSVWSTLNLAWNHSVTAGGFDPGKIDGCFPASGTFFNGSINIAADDVDGPDSITHEYGHGVMARAYSGGDPSPGGAHGFGDCGQNQALSWSEGWATAFMLTLRQDGRYNWSEGDGGRAIEAFSSSCQTGESSEGRVAAALLDMTDSANDTNGGSLNLGRNGASDSNTGNTVAMATMLRDTLQSTQHSTVVAFWNDLSGELTSAQRAPAQTVMNYNWMPVALPASCVATKVASQTLAAPEREGLLAGLRQFRDHAMVPWPSGRAMANLYYRNSPEMALALLKNPDRLPDAMAVMKHFSDLGRVFTTHARFTPFAQTDAPLLNADVHAAALRVLDMLAKEGSGSLREDAQAVKTELDRLLQTRLSDIQKRAAQEKKEVVQSGKSLPPVRRQDHAPGSKEALNDKRLQEFLERSATTRVPR
jgi:hypothetical protein